MGKSFSLCKLDISSCIRLGKGKGKKRGIFKVGSTGNPPSNLVLNGTPHAVVGPPPVGAEAEPVTAVKRIKVVITRQQLQELLTKKMPVEAVVLGIDRSDNSVDSPTSWKPILKSIPEENEL